MRRGQTHGMYLEGTTFRIRQLIDTAFERKKRKVGFFLFVIDPRSTKMSVWTEMGRMNRAFVVGSCVNS